MNCNLLIQAMTKFVAGVLAMGLLLFLPAGTIKYWNAWLLLGILFLPMLMIGIILLRHNPDLLRKRLNTKETESEQKIVVLFSGILFAGGFVLCGLDYRFQWMVLPGWVVAAAAIVCVISYGLYAEVLRENTYLSRTVEIQNNQTVIDTGLYGIVRHPMYLSTILLFLSIPLVLGSLVTFVLFLVYPVIVAKRIRNEEEVLENGLEGYADYKKRVKYKVIPFLW